jgi:MYXO-CTERM domain-containing protein
MCPGGLVCNPQNGVCEQDPCLGVTCPGVDQVCVGGSCYAPNDLVDAGVDADTESEFVTAGGGGGCQTGGRGGAGAALLILALALATRRRVRREVAS